VRTKLSRYAAVIAVAALGMLVSTAAVASARGHGTRTLRIVGHLIQSESVDLGTPGPSLGDELVFSERLSVRGHGVGVSGVVCTATQVTPPYDVTRFHCVATLKLRRGQITLQGLIEVQGVDDPGPFSAAITGGTGAFRGAGGEATIRHVTPTRSVYKLRFDSKRSARS
jgi:allene oxide cyclase-like protein